MGRREEGFGMQTLLGGTVGVNGEVGSVPSVVSYRKIACHCSL